MQYCSGPQRQLHLPDVAWPAARSAALWAFCRRHVARAAAKQLNISATSGGRARRARRALVRATQALLLKQKIGEKLRKEPRSPVNPGPARDLNLSECPTRHQSNALIRKMGRTQKTGVRGFSGLQSLDRDHDQLTTQDSCRAGAPRIARLRGPAPAPLYVSLRLLPIVACLLLLGCTARQRPFSRSHTFFARRCLACCRPMTLN